MGALGEFGGAEGTPATGPWPPGPLAAEREEGREPGHEGLAGGTGHGQRGGRSETGHRERERAPPPGRAAGARSGRRGGTGTGGAATGRHRGARRGQEGTARGGSGRRACGRTEWGQSPVPSSSPARPWLQQRHRHVPRTTQDPALPSACLRPPPSLRTPERPRAGTESGVSTESKAGKTGGRAGAGGTGAQSGSPRAAQSPSRKGPEAQSALGYCGAAWGMPGYSEAVLARSTPGYSEAVLAQSTPGYNEAVLAQSTPGYSEAVVAQSTPGYSETIPTGPAWARGPVTHRDGGPWFPLRPAGPAALPWSLTPQHRPQAPAWGPTAGRVFGEHPGTGRLGARGTPGAPLCSGVPGLAGPKSSTAPGSPPGLGDSLSWLRTSPPPRQGSSTYWGSGPPQPRL